MTVIKKTAIRAEMARRQLLPQQLETWEGDYGPVNPKTDPATLDEVWRFLAWLDRCTADWREQ